VTYRISLQTLPEPGLNVRTSDTLRVTFTVADKSSGKGVVPHQTFIRFYDPITKEEGVQPIRVSNAGKAKFDLVSVLSNYSQFPIPPLYSLIDMIDS